MVVSLILFISSCQRDAPPTPHPENLNQASATPSNSPTAAASATITPIASNSDTIALEALPEVQFLGDGPGQFNVPGGFNFIVKRRRPYRIVYINGPLYEAAQDERVWQIRGQEQLFQVYEAEHDFGAIGANCTIKYVQIDDDVDGRRNRFYLNGNEVHLMAQGMTVNGEFTVGAAGQLTLFAEDSIAANIEVICPPPDPPTPVTSTRTPPPPPTSTPTLTPTPDPILTITPTVDPPEEGLTPTPTPTETLLPPTTPPTTPTVTATAVPQGPAYTRFNFEMAGHSGRNGSCTMRRDTGDLLLVWEMQDGWTDSSTHPDADANGWIELFIPHASIYVEVFCNDGSGEVRMDIHNGVRHPDTGRIVGWLTRGVYHAIEIGWPGD